MIKVLVVDDHQLFLDGISAIFSLVEGIAIVGTCINQLQLIECATNLDIDVVLMDIAIGNDDGIAFTQYLQEHRPEVKVIALSMHNDPATVVKMLKAGASGYILKKATRTELTHAITSVQNGEAYYSPEIATDLVNRLFKKELPELLTEQTILSNREIEIIKLIADGQPNKIIGDKLNITESTVKTHRQRILHKLDLKNTSEMLKYAYTRKLI